MALLSSSLFPSPLPIPDSTNTPRNCRFLPHIPRRIPSPAFLPIAPARKNHPQFSPIASHLCTDQNPITLDRPALSIAEAASEAELWAAVHLRVRSFYEFNDQTYGVEDHKRYLSEREFEALKDRIAGKRIGFNRVSCINATIPISQTLRSSNGLCTACKGIGADFARAYLSNVCVAAELHQNGIGYALVAKSKKIARQWGVTDLYAHVAIDNEPAKKLYTKSGFIYENEEPAWQARFLGRPRRLLLWADLSMTTSL
ncbi:GCN5-related N-acetyltransferase 7, chloroplastic isoform X2 [Magnolia sinica]|uniref:GCN5-related N-acetyltransferase 7, chloroplastic isoform X2 n=1 Tax=Magnolia sinica TaxID=86752 RepID=UPI00265B06A0|nr:GCN5-related N-acetyltransferase 7, chloroplastic isoform X2 [Magnolia sinica]